jgi:hypothetical protein
VTPGLPCGDRDSVLRLLRGWLSQRGPWDVRGQVARESLSLYALAFMRSFLRATTPRWGRGFADPLCETIDEAADITIAGLLREGPLGSRGQVTLPVLERDLRASLRHLAVEGSEEERILLALHKLLRLKARQGLQRIWREHHPEEARLLRRLKCRIMRLEGIRVVRDSRGQFVVGSRSDLREPPITREDLARWCQSPGFLTHLDDMSRTLHPILVPNGIHGGYCYLMDLVHTIHAGRCRILSEAPERTGAVPAESAGMAAVESIHNEEARRWWAGRLEERAWPIAEQQEGKWRRRRARRCANDPPAGHRCRQLGLRVRVDVAVEMVCRKLGLGRPEWEGLSQRRLMKQLLPPTTRGEDLRRHQVQTDYVVRCLMRDLRSEAIPSRTPESSRPGSTLRPSQGPHGELRGSHP